MNRPASLYMVTIAGSFWAVMAVLWGLQGSQLLANWPMWLPLLGVAMIAEAFEVATGEGGDGVMSFSGGAHVAAVILFGPVTAALIAAGAVVLVDGARSQPRRLVAANSAMFGWSALAAGGAYELAGGHIGSVTSGSAMALVALVVVRGLVNATVFSVGESLVTGTPPARALLATLNEGAVTYAGEGGLGVLVAEGWNAQHWVILPFLIPLFGALVAAKANLERLRAETGAALGAFARVIDERDPNTARHTERVAAYVARFTAAVGMPAREAARLVEAARYHDLGKIAVDEATLSKAGRLDDAELRAIRRHPRLSAALLSPFGFARDIARYVELHHERYDSRGYYAVESGEIPLEAHVLIVADSFDAMTSARAYRPALTPEEAAQELLDKAGQQFHPVVAEAFAAMIRGEDVTARLGDEALTGLRGGFEKVPLLPRTERALLGDPRMLVVGMAGVSMLGVSLLHDPLLRVLMVAAAALACVPAICISVVRGRRAQRALAVATQGRPAEQALAAAGIAGTPLWLTWCPQEDAYSCDLEAAESDEICRRAVRATAGTSARLHTGRYLILSSETPQRRRLAVIVEVRPRRSSEQLVERLCRAMVECVAADVRPQPSRRRLPRPQRAALLIELNAFERIRTGAGQLAAQRAVTDAADAVGAVLRSGDAVEIVGDDDLAVWLSSAGAEETAALAGRIETTLAAVAVPKRVGPIAARVRVAISPAGGADEAAHSRLIDLTGERPRAVGE